MRKIPKSVAMKNGQPVMQRAIVTHEGYTRIFYYFVIKEIPASQVGQRVIIAYSVYLGGLFLIIDNEIQFTKIDLDKYHGGMVCPAMILRNGDNIAIYGGGDGLAAWEVLLFGVVPKIIEWDNTVVNLCKKYFARLNHGSLNKSKIIYGDALKHVPKELYDLIFMDLTAPTACKKLYTPKAMKKWLSDLKEDGIIVFYADYKMAPKFYNKIKKYFKYSCAYGSYMEFVGSLFTFCMFSNRPLDVEKVRNSDIDRKYFCGKHFHELDPSKFNVRDFPETFSIVDV